MSNYSFGASSEQHAVDYLTKNGYRILCRNYRTPKGEIDIIAALGDTICMVEVKARRSLYFGTPQQAVNLKKRQRIVEVAHSYIIDNDLDAEVQFDIIAIVKQGQDIQLEHIKDAFKAH